MMNLNSRGQGAMEYVMNYGWAVIVIMIIGVTMWYLGVFNLGKTVEIPIVAGFSSIKPLADNIIFTTDGDFAGIFVNAAGSYIEVTGVKIVNSDGTTCHGEIIGSEEVATGEEFVIGGTACSKVSHNVGDQYSINMSINYTTKLGSASLPHTERGFISGTYGGGIADVIPADTYPTACTDAGYSWMIPEYCRDGDCPVPPLPKCCGDDPGEFFKVSMGGTACCAHDTSCASITSSHWCYVQSTVDSQIYICDGGGWYKCGGLTGDIRCFERQSHWCFNETGPSDWKWMTPNPGC